MMWLHGSSPTLLAAIGKIQVQSYFVATKPLDHRPVRQQAAKQPVVSPEATDVGSADSGVHTHQDWDTRIDLSQRAQTHRWHPTYNQPWTLHISLRLYFAYLSNNDSLTSQ